jgi:autotransporter passenger strand-loop-strand repeat protein
MTTVSNGQTLYVSSGQTDSGTTVLNGGTEYVSFGGIADATAISGTVDDYGTVSGATIFNGGVETVFSGGVASNTTASGGHQMAPTVSLVFPVRRTTKVPSPMMARVAWCASWIPVTGW